MTNEENKKNLSLKQILEEAKNNPLKNKYPPELIAKYNYFNEKINAISQSSPYFILAQKLESLNSFFRNAMFDEKFKQNPLLQIAESQSLIQKSISKLYGEFYSNFKIFSEMDWYVSPRIFDETSIIELVQKEGIELEDLIISETEKLIPEILKSCSDHFETRRTIFEEIAKAFENKMYYSVVVLAYTQADGICNDKFQKGFFDTKKEKKVDEFELMIWNIIKNVDLNHSIGVLEQLSIRSNEISANSKKGKFTNPEVQKTSFNRHLVLHGHSVEFGTKVNAIRSICLLDFLHFLFTEIIQE